jgi:hypothetical protein
MAKKFGPGEHNTFDIGEVADDFHAGVPVEECIKKCIAKQQADIDDAFAGNGQA